MIDPCLLILVYSPPLQLEKMHASSKNLEMKENFLYTLYYFPAYVRAASSTVQAVGQQYGHLVDWRTAQVRVTASEDNPSGNETGPGSCCVATG